MKEVVASTSMTHEQKWMTKKKQTQEDPKKWGPSVISSSLIDKQCNK